MTAEIAILNTYGVALAADSAVTLDLGNGEKKIYNSANKLFMLSKYHPVGIMIYNSAKLLDIDWELIIKLYRKELGTNKFNYLHDYSNHFLKFIMNNKSLLTNECEKMYFERISYIHMKYICDQIQIKAQEIIASCKAITEDELLNIIDTIINNEYNKWEKIDNNELISLNKNKILKRYKQTINDLSKTVFEKLPISSDQFSKIQSIIIFSLTKKQVLNNYTGIVISGYGEKEFYPSINSFLIEGMIDRKLKYIIEHDKSATITLNNKSVIVPFAQSEMVASFMEGVDPQYEGFIEKQLSITIEKMKDLLDSAENKDKADEIRKLFVKTLASFRRKIYVEPVISIVSSLPKEDLANMAESLVNLTSFKRKVSSEAETVGGPIDVAVISKCDGFIWIKRKHYFKPDLNAHFFANYYKEV
jgi:hypothetical protein